MGAPKPTDLAHRYLVEHLPGSAIPASRLHGILEKVEKGRSLTKNESAFLKQRGLTALEKLGRGEITYESFEELASRENAERERLEEAERQAKIASLNAIEAEYQAKQEAARLAQESDPKYIAKMKNRMLRDRYGVDSYVEPTHLPTLMKVLRRFDSGNRLTDENVLWLTTKGRKYFSERFRAAFHEREAKFYLGEYRRTSDPWNAVNASSHYRKCNEARKAHDLLDSIPEERQMAPKLKSALATTHGGVMRDLQRLDEAMEFGNKAHKTTPKDFRPCTLLGAVNYELGHYVIAREWYAKAIERGAEERSLDHELRGIFRRADSAKRKELAAFLLNEDPHRYRWVNDVSGRKRRSTGDITEKPS